MGQNTGVRRGDQLARIIGQLKPLAAIAALVLAGCVSSNDAGKANPASTTESPTTDSLTTNSALSDQASTTTSPKTAPPITRPPWLGLRPLATNPDGSYIPVETPPQLLNRAFASDDTLGPPASAEFAWSIAPFVGEPLERSTYQPECPVPAEELSYLTMSFWGFDGAHHSGEMVVDAEWAEQIVSVFATLHEARFPLEEMRLVTPDDLVGVSSGDDNNTTAYVCRAVTGGQRWSDHALGTAIDINPFHNPYQRGEVILPGLASAYLDRENPMPGMIERDGLVVRAFSEIGWSWGGDWETISDYQHFSLSGR